MMQSINEVVHAFADLNIKYLKNINLRDFSHTKTGGKIQLMVYPHKLNELKSILTELKENNLNYIVLGDMTNVAIASNNLNFVVINMSEFLSKPIYNEEKNILEVSAGYEMKQLAQWGLEHSVSGLQWMEGIPGTVGAGVYMNAGFLAGQDFQSYLIDATVLMSDLTVQTISNRVMNFSYRKSILQNNGGIVLSIRLLVRKGKKWRVALKMARYHHRRAKHQPLELPSAGTVFIPPTPYHVGGMLPKLGLVGYQIGGAQISEKSPGFIVGVDHMTGEDYYALVKLIQKKVMDTYGIELIPEVRLLGFRPFDENK